MSDYADLRAKAEAAHEATTKGDEWLGEVWLRRQVDAADAAYIAACSPDVLVGLLDRIDALRLLLVDARAEIDRWGYGDFHFGPTPRDPEVLAMLERIDKVLGEADA